MENEEKGEIIATNREEEEGKGGKEDEEGDGEGEDTCTERREGKRRRTIMFIHSNCKCN